MSDYSSRDASSMSCKRSRIGISLARVALAAIVMLSVLLLVNMSYRWLATSDFPFIQFLLNGESLVLSAEDGKALGRDLSERLAGLEVAAEERLQPWVES